MKEVKNNVEEDLSEDEMLIDGVCESGEDDTACESDSIRNDELWEVKNMLGQEHDRCHDQTGLFWIHVTSNIQYCKYTNWFEQKIDKLKETIEELVVLNSWSDIKRLNNIFMEGFGKLEELRRNICRNHRVKQQLRDLSWNVG